jgi:hypothetical protein
MSDEHSFSLRHASAEYRDLAGKLRELGRACVSAKPIAACGIARSQSHPLRLPGLIGGPFVKTPEWMLWVLVSLLLFVMCLPGLKR